LEKALEPYIAKAAKQGRRRSFTPFEGDQRTRTRDRSCRGSGLG
jgi:hypothetical protein